MTFLKGTVAVECLRIRHFANESVVFDEYAGKTVLLSYPVGVLLAELQRGPLSLDEIAARLLEVAGLNPEVVDAYVRESIQALSQQGLVEYDAET